jgi:hypothetical protein
MSFLGDLRRLPDEPGASRYALVCLGGLFAIVLVLLEHGYGSWSLLPVLAGVFGGLTRFGPVLVPTALAMLLNAPPRLALPFSHRSALQLADLILGAGTLAYVIAHYRLQGLLVHLFPPDPRRRGKSAPPRRERRPARLATLAEIGGMLLIVPVLPFLAQLVWRWLPTTWGNPGIRPDIWFGILLTWVIGLTLLIIASAVSYWRQRQMDPEAARLFLQDVLWQETRSEQRRVSRWLAWARLHRSEAVRKGYRTPGLGPGNEDLRHESRGPVPFSDSRPVASPAKEHS